MSLIGNILWLVFGGFIAAMIYILGGISFLITIIGIPFAKQHFKLIPVALFPLQKEFV